MREQGYNPCSFLFIGMKTLLKEYIKHIVAETLKEQLFRKTKPKSMFANYQSGGGGGGGGGGSYDYDYTIGSHGDVNVMGVPNYDNSYDFSGGGLDEQDDSSDSDGGDSDSGGDSGGDI
jgi:hypothetical protein